METANIINLIVIVMTDEKEAKKKKKTSFTDSQTDRNNDMAGFKPD